MKNMETIRLFGDVNMTVDEVCKKTIQEVNTSLSMLTDDLISAAEHDTETKKEFIAYMKGAAFIFYHIAQRKGAQYGTPSIISTTQQAIEHLIKLLPFMAGDEKVEHLLLMNWLNELRRYKNEEIIKIPDDYYTDEDICNAIDEIKSRLHAEEHDNFNNSTLINF